MTCLVGLASEDATRQHFVTALVAYLGEVIVRPADIVFKITQMASYRQHEGRLAENPHICSHRAGRSTHSRTMLLCLDEPGDRPLEHVEHHILHCNTVRLRRPTWKYLSLQTHCQAAAIGYTGAMICVQTVSVLNRHWLLKRPLGCPTINFSSHRGFYYSAFQARTYGIDEC